MTRDQQSANDASVEASRLRRTLRDVIALSMLPSVWSGYDARQICADLVDVLARMIDADGILLTAPANGCGSVLRTKRAGDGDVERVLREAGAGTGAHATLRSIAFPLSFDSADRLAVAANRPDFPTEDERLILRLAVNQASTWLAWKRAEARLAAESTFRRAIESSIPAGVASVDASGRQTYVNPAFAAMVGWSEAELIGRTPPFPYWPPEELDAIRTALEDVLAGRANPGGYELRFRRRDEQRFDALVLISRFTAADGSPGFVASVSDITQRKSAERTTRFLADAGELLSRSLDYEETLRAISALVVPRFADWCFVDLLDGAGGFRRVAAGHPPGEKSAAIAARLQRFYAPKSTGDSIFTHTFMRGGTTVMNDVPETLLLDFARDEDHRDALLALAIRCFVAVPLTSNNRTFGVITFLGTEKRTRFEAADVALAEELARRVALAVDNARLYRSAQEANRAKDEFLASLSHELRTPMTAILGWTHLLQLGDLEPEQIALGLQTIQQSGQAQAKLIDDLLDVSRIVTGKFRLNPSRVRLSEVLDATIAVVRPAAEAKRQRLDVDAGDAIVFGDAARLQQVFWNLLSNAVKFTPAGGVVRVALAAREDEVDVTVTDTGEGIPRDFLPFVFDRFRQGAPGGRSRAGLGLGLAIAKELVQMHGGSIAVASEGAGRGATFRVTLPRVADMGAGLERRDVPQRTHDRLRELRVLLVEDDETTRTLLNTVLVNFGATVSAASSATDAVGILDAFDPQILVTDIEMPGGDGVALLSMLRTRGARLPAIAISGYADYASRERVMDAGFDGFVAKPLDPTRLADEILRALSSGNA